MIEIRWARPQERSFIQRYLYENMGKIPYERWANILDCRWTPGEDRYGVVVTEGGRLRGFLGIVFADRESGGVKWRTGNITSWFLAKELRRAGLGQKTLELITSDPDVTYTATSPNIRSGSLLHKVSWEVLDDRRLVWRRTGAEPAAAVKHISADEAGPILGPSAKKILDDHAGLNIMPFALTAPSGASCLVVIYVKLKGEDIAYHEVLHVSDRALFARHAADFANAVLPPEKAILACDSRFVPPGTTADQILILDIPRYWKPAGVPAHEVDFLYSEVVLLDLKIQ